MPRTYFISGTDTNVGKTIVSTVLATKLEAYYFKPIQCGLNEMNLRDSEIVKSLSDKVKILNELDKTKYFLESKNITFKENFDNLLSFFYKLRSIGANVNTENREKSLIRFRNQKSNLSVFYNINFVLIKKL